jgi:hypothetical protein
MVKQMSENETADKADWLIGEGLLLPGSRGLGCAHKVMDPGTAYNDLPFVTFDNPSLARSLSIKV